MISKNSHSDNVVTVTVDYGYDIHSVELKRTEYQRIFKGEAIEVQGAGFSIEGKIDSDFWIFNKERPGSIYVTTESLHEIYSGAMGDGNVHFDPDPHDLNSGSKYNAEGWAESQAWQKHRRPNPNIFKKLKEK